MTGHCEQCDCKVAVVDLVLVDGCKICPKCVLQKTVVVSTVKLVDVLRDRVTQARKHRLEAVYDPEYFAGKQAAYEDIINLIASEKVSL